MSRILVVDDERAIRLALRGLFTRDGHEVVEADSGEAAIERLAEERFDLVLTDLALGDVDGLAVLRASKASRPEVPVVMITAHGNEKVAVGAMKAGADDYVPKPFDNDELRLVIGRELSRTQLEREHRLLMERVEREYGFGALIGSGPAMRHVFDTIARVAETDLGVLVRGESGTGKELVAQAIHQRSSRRERPFVAVNCAAISRELVESELFGHEKGAFTGASAQRAGRFEAAHGGTIFLDEVGDMPLATQAKVLRVLQEQRFERVGGTRPLETDVRVIAATHRDLEAEVEAGNYREDLYYRLRVVEIRLPPLRERTEDLPALAERFLERIAERTGQPRSRLDEAATRALCAHAWPGNVRELEHAVQRAAVLTEGAVIGVDALDLGRPRARTSWLPTEGETFAETKRRLVTDFERAYFGAALTAHGGNISRAAETVGMARQSLQQKLRDLGLRDGEGSDS
ncbi:MAG: sigma-54-dependent Fis family transcriptional regulator [Sandaracinaceae bacterium]|nr:sigma-54-dependent Fis family transcriptional regulator [Sandaracinaceae bacterium]